VNGNSQLRSLLAEWRRLTKSEAVAIAGNDWAGLLFQQSSKVEVRRRISSLVSAAASSAAPSRQAVAREQNLHPLLAEILALESRNRDTLQAKRRDQQLQLNQTAETVLRLQGLRRAYTAGAPRRSHSYS
jgi:hypothetical protein